MSGGNARFYRLAWSMPGSPRKAAWSICRRRRSPSSSIPGRAGSTRCSENARWPCLSSGIGNRRCTDDIREVQGLRPSHHAPRLGDQARDQECPGVRVRRRGNDPRLEGSSVCRAARRGVHLERNHGERPLRPDFLAEHHQRRVPHPAQRPGARDADAAQPGRVLGRPFHTPGRIRLHQESRLRAGAARPGRVHRLRSGRHEGADEGRDHRAFQAAHRAMGAISASPSPASSPRSRPIRSSASW